MRGPTIKVSPQGEIYTTESALQQYCVKFFRTVYAPIGKHLFSIPNGGKYGGKVNKRGVSIQASIMVGEGLTEGVADLMLALPRSGLHGLYIEMKTPVGRWEEAQKEFAQRQIKEGYGYVICWCADDFEQVVNDYLRGLYVQIPFESIPTTKLRNDTYKKSIKGLAG